MTRPAPEMDAHDCVKPLGRQRGDALQEPVDDALGGIGLAAPFLADNGNVGIKRGAIRL